MIEFVRRLFVSDFMPHGMCLFWQPGIIWLHVTSDALTALAYFCIPFTLVYLVKRRRDLVFNWMFVLFGIFILACGTTHLMSIWTLWHGTYRLDGLIKAITALASVPTAILLVRLMPQAVMLPSPEQLRIVNHRLEAEIAERRIADREVRRLNADLERRVGERTAQLEESNRQLQRINRLFQRSNEDLSQYAHAASHDLREPMRIIALNSELVQRRYSNLLDRDAGELLQRMNGAARHMERLLSDLLVYSQVQDAAESDTSVTCGNEIFAKATASLEIAIAENEARVTRDELPRVAVPEIHLLQLLQNLIGNAIKYRRSVPPEIHVSAERSGPMWELRVRDNGIGIDPQYSTTIFSLFERLNGNKYPGTGLGLSLCQRIVDQYGGRIWVESEPEKGATFHFTWPSAE
jgi:signal transduction histidine kinase